MTGRTWARVACSLALASSLAISNLAWAQEVASSQPEITAATATIADSGESASPFGAVAVTNEDAAAVKMPVLAFKPTGVEAQDFDKYYYFHRADTDFATAYADIAECDGYARGLSSGVSYTQAPYPYTYTMAGAVGGAIGNLMVEAIAGSAERRRLRRVNMRQCMHYKGYERHGITKDLWQEFNFEEGLASVKETDRQRYLKQQALVASSAKPEAKGLGL